MVNVRWAEDELRARSERSAPSKSAIRSASFDRVSLISYVRAQKRLTDKSDGLLKEGVRHEPVTLAGRICT
jgi:hypothetical protein